MLLTAALVILGNKVELVIFTQKITEHPWYMKDLYRFKIQ